MNNRNSKKTLLSTLETMAKAGNKAAADMLTDYRNGLISIQDGVIRSIQQANAVTEIALFDATNEKRDGIYTLSKGMLDKGVGFIVTGIALLATQVTDQVAGSAVPRVMNPRSTEEYAAMLDGDAFGSIAAIPALANGELTIRINRKPINDKFAASVFCNETGVAGVNKGPIGYYHLDTPIFIASEVPIEFMLRLGTTNPTPASTLVEVVLYGAQTLTT